MNEEVTVERARSLVVVYRLHRQSRRNSGKPLQNEGVNTMATAPSTEVVETKLNRALELIGGSIDPEIAESYSSLEERILAQALENVELAERRLREIQKLVGDLNVVSGRHVCSE
jgi:hypothetical protein